MKPATDNLELYRGDTHRVRRVLEVPSTGEDYVLTGCTATAQIRATSMDASVLYEFTCTLESGDTAVLMVIDAGETDNAPDTAVWDWQLQFTDGSVRTFGAGTVTFSGQVTRPVTP